MSNYILNTIISLAIFSCSAFAQADDHHRKREVKDNIEARKIAYITSALDLSSEEAQNFWPLHNDYRKEMDGLRASFRELKDQEDVNAEMLLDKHLELEQKQLDTKTVYAKKVSQLLGAERALTLLKTERKFKEKLLKGLKDRHKRKSPMDERR